MDEVTYVRKNGNKIMLRDIIGNIKSVVDAEIEEVNVLTTELKIRRI
jgi:predicted RNA-binding protein